MSLLRKEKGGYAIIVGEKAYRTVISTLCGIPIGVVLNGIGHKENAACH